jgi:hypothetical protein
MTYRSGQDSSDSQQSTVVDLYVNSDQAGFRKEKYFCVTGLFLTVMDVGYVALLQTSSIGDLLSGQFIVFILIFIYVGKYI